ncbi:hypothetical protein K438DRAFT_1790649 [Mycena galopus ATCC 62051]|nr:hypothetical protein K438DRAFT_1790649 [Mycena galopus ATCC 62051]
MTGGNKDLLKKFTAASLTKEAGTPEGLRRLCKIVGGHAFWSQNAAQDHPTCGTHISTTTTQNPINPHTIRIVSSSRRAPQLQICDLMPLLSRYLKQPFGVCAAIPNDQWVLYVVCINGMGLIWVLEVAPPNLRSYLFQHQHRAENHLYSHVLHTEVPYVHNLYSRVREVGKVWTVTSTYHVQNIWGTLRATIGVISSTPNTYPTHCSVAVSHTHAKRPFEPVR